MLHSLWAKHGFYIASVYKISFFLSGAYAFWLWIGYLTEVLREGSIIGAIFLFLLQSIYIGANALVGGAFWGTIFVVLLFGPYLLVRGLFK